MKRWLFRLSSIDEEMSVDNNCISRIEWTYHLLRYMISIRKSWLSYGTLEETTKGCIDSSLCLKVGWFTQWRESLIYQSTLTLMQVTSMYNQKPSRAFFYNLIIVSRYLIPSTLEQQASRNVLRQIKVVTLWKKFINFSCIVQQPIDPFSKIPFISLIASYSHVLNHNTSTTNNWFKEQCPSPNSAWSLQYVHRNASQSFHWTFCSYH